jgi:hypothetical protein
MMIDELGRSTGLERPVLDTSEFVEECASFIGINVEDLAGRGRAVDVVRAREMLATLGVERYGLRVKNIASEFNKSAEAASRMVSRGAEKRMMNIEFREEYDELDRHIVRAVRRSGRNIISGSLAPLPIGSLRHRVPDLLRPTKRPKSLQHLSKMKQVISNQ